MVDVLTKLVDKEMAKLPTTFQTLDLTGFEIEKTNYREVTGSMVETTCAVLQKNRV